MTVSAMTVPVGAPVQGLIGRLVTWLAGLDPASQEHELPMVAEAGIRDAVSRGVDRLRAEQDGLRIVIMVRRRLHLLALAGGAAAGRA